jgi:hypothetical protein
MSIGYLDEEARVYGKFLRLIASERIRGMLVGPEVIVNQDPYLDLIKLVGINNLFI